MLKVYIVWIVYEWRDDEYGLARKILNITK